MLPIPKHVVNPMGNHHFTIWGTIKQTIKWETCHIYTIKIIIVNVSNIAYAYLSVSFMLIVSCTSEFSEFHFIPTAPELPLVAGSMYHLYHVSSFTNPSTNQTTSRTKTCMAHINLDKSS